MTTSTTTGRSRRRDTPVDGVAVEYADLWAVAERQVGRARRHVDFYAPFVSPDVLRRLAAAIATGVSANVVVRWRLVDFLAGVADFAVFDVCEELKWPLFMNQRLHLKSVLCDYSSLVTGSANLTRTGLGLVPYANRETFVGPLAAPGSYVSFLQGVKTEALLLDRSIVDRMKMAVDKLRAAADVLRDGIDAENGAIKQFMESAERKLLVSQLPMSREWQVIHRVATGAGAVSEEDRACALHDLATYKLEARPGETMSAFRARVRAAFLEHPFIRAVQEFIDRPRRFGEIKEWVQDTCADVPVPSRRSLTGNVQVLYRWLVEFGDGRFEVVRPYHSELIQPAGWSGALPTEARDNRRPRESRGRAVGDRPRWRRSRQRR